MAQIIIVACNLLKYYLIFYVILIGSYAAEHYYIKFLTDYWSIMPEDMFLEKVIDILFEYDENIHYFENSDFIKRSKELYRKNNKLRIKLFKSGLKDRFIEYFGI